MSKLHTGEKYTTFYYQVFTEIWDNEGRLHEINKYCSGWRKIDQADGYLFIKDVEWEEDNRKGGAVVMVIITNNSKPPTISIQSWSQEG